MNNNLETDKAGLSRTLARCGRFSAFLMSTTLFAASFAAPASAVVLQVEFGEVYENFDELLLDSILSYNDGQLLNHNLLTNDGWLDNNGTLDNSGTLNNTDTLTNYGTLTNSGTLDNSGWIDNDGTLTNSGTLNISGTGVLFNFGTLDNSGTLTNSGILENIETLNNVGTLTNYGDLDNFGTLNNSGILLNEGALVNIGTLNNTGTLENNGTLQNYGILYLTQLPGDTSLLQGDIHNGDTVVFDLTSYSAYSGNMTGSGTLTVTGGGTLDLTGTVSQAGGTTVSAGGLAVNGTLISDLSLAGGTLLSGSGTIIGNVTTLGDIGPGNSQGTLNITGDFGMDAGSVLNIELDAFGSDVLAVTGTATIAGTLALDMGSALIADGATYDVLTAGTLAGTFDTITVNTFLAMAPSYSPTTVTVTVTRLDYATAGSTPNQLAIAGALDEAVAAGGVTGDTLTVLTALDNVGSVADAAAAFDQMGAENYGAFVTAAQITGDGFASSIRRRMSAVSDDGDAAGLWITGHANFGRLQSTSTLEGYKVDSFGFTVGAEFDLGEDSRGGIAGGYSTSDIDGKLLDRKGGIKGYQIGAYAGTRVGSLDATLLAFYGSNDGEMGRTISFGSISRTAAADLDGSEFRVSGFVSRKMSTDGLVFSPYAGLEYSDLSFDAFSETGADALNLSVDKLDGTRFLGEVGVGFSGESGGIAPSGYVGYRYDFDHDNLMVGASLMGQSHLVGAQDRGNGTFVFGAGISSATSSSIGFYLRYDGEMSGEFSSHQGSGGIRVTF